jgi:ArsR family transcriptional regulator
MTVNGFAENINASKLEIFSRHRRTHFVFFDTSIMVPISVLKALASESRMQILTWLKDPTAHFPPQVDGDLERDGVCSVFIAKKLNVSQPTASEHLHILTDAGVVKVKRIKQWVFYRRDERRLAEIKRAFRHT